MTVAQGFPGAAAGRQPDAGDRIAVDTDGGHPSSTTRGSHGKLVASRRLEIEIRGIGKNDGAGVGVLGFGPPAGRETERAARRVECAAGYDGVCAGSLVRIPTAHAGIGRITGVETGIAGPEI